MNVLVNALFGMKVKGRIAITGTLGYDVSYVRTFSDGRWARDSSDHQSLRHVRRGLVGQPLHRLEPSALKIIINEDSKKRSGTLLRACQSKIHKQHASESLAPHRRLATKVSDSMTASPEDQFSPPSARW